MEGMQGRAEPVYTTEHSSEALSLQALLIAVERHSKQCVLSSPSLFGLPEYEHEDLYFEKDHGSNVPTAVRGNS